MTRTAPAPIRRAVAWLRGGWADMDIVDHVFDNGPPWAQRVLDSRALTWVERRPGRWLARGVCRWWGHTPTIDHCGMPKHDYCEGCGILMPGLADRTGMEMQWAFYRARHHAGEPVMACPYVYREGRWWGRHEYAAHSGEPIDG